MYETQLSDAEIDRVYYGRKSRVLHDKSYPLNPLNIDYRQKQVYNPNKKQ